MGKFTVTLNYRGTYGFLEYDETTKSAEVTFPLAEEKARVEEFLKKPLTLDVVEGKTIYDFTSKTLDPLESIESLKTCLTRLWVNTGVLVEWSMPPGMAGEL